MVKVHDKVLLKALKQHNNIQRALKSVGLPSTQASYNRCYQLLEGHRNELNMPR